MGNSAVQPEKLIGDILSGKFCQDNLGKKDCSDSKDKCKKRKGKCDKKHRKHRKRVSCAAPCVAPCAAPCAPSCAPCGSADYCVVDGQRKPANYDWQLSRHVDLTLANEIRCLPVFNEGHMHTSDADAVCFLYQYAALTQQEAFKMVNKVIVANPSRLFVDYNGRQVGKGQVSLESCLESINRFGICEDALWTYTERHHKERPPIYAYAAAQRGGSRKILFEKISANDPDKVRQAKQAINNNQPLAASFSVYDSFNRAHDFCSTGLICLPSERELCCKPKCCHSLVLVGYDDASQTFLARNNRGDCWGLHGYCRIPYGYVMDPRLCADLWSVSSNSLDKVAQLNYDIEVAPPAQDPRWMHYRAVGELEFVDQLQ